MAIILTIIFKKIILSLSVRKSCRCKSLIFGRCIMRSFHPTFIFEDFHGDCCLMPSLVVPGYLSLHPRTLVEETLVGLGLLQPRLPESPILFRRRREEKLLKMSPPKLNFCTRTHNKSLISFKKKLAKLSSFQC